MSDIRQSILNVKTPPGDRDVFYAAINKEPASFRRENSDHARTYRKYLDSNNQFTTNKRLLNIIFKLL